MDALFRNLTKIIQLRNQREKHEIKTESVQAVNGFSFIAKSWEPKEVISWQMVLFDLLRVLSITFRLG